MLFDNQTISMKTILYVEDEYFALDAVEDYVEKEQYLELYKVQHLNDAWDFIIRNENISLLICDIRFPDLKRNDMFESGEDLIAKVKENRPEIPICIVSGNDKPFFVKRMVEKYKPMGYLIKSETPDYILLDAVKSIIYNRTKYTSQSVNSKILEARQYDIDDIDYQIIISLANGAQVKELPDVFMKKLNLKIGKRTIESRLTNMRELFESQTNNQLIYQAAERGIL